MKANLKNSEHGKASFEIIVDKDTFKKALDDAYRKNRNRFSIPGFRKGRVPRQIIEAHYGKDVFVIDAIEDLFPIVYSNAVDELELDIMSRPSLLDQRVEDNGELVLDIEVATLPVVTLPDYKSYTFESALPEVTEEDILAELQKQVETFPNQIPVEESTEETVVEFDLDSYLVNEDKTSLVGRQSKLNKGLNNITSIDNEEIAKLLVGKKVGDVVTLDLDEENNPTNKTEEIKHHDKITITNIYTVEEPEIDDEFVQKISFYDTVDDYKEFLSDILETEKNQYFIVNEYPRLLQQLLADSEVEFSDLYTEEVQEEISNDQNKLASFLQFFYDRTSPEKTPTENYLSFVRDLSILEEVADELGYQISNDDLVKELQYLPQTSIIPALINQLDPTEARMVLHYLALNRLITSYLAQIATQNVSDDQVEVEETVSEEEDA